MVAIKWFPTITYLLCPGVDDELTVVGVDNLHEQLEVIPNKIYKEFADAISVAYILRKVFDQLENDVIAGETQVTAPILTEKD